MASTETDWFELWLYAFPTEIKKNMELTLTFKNITHMWQVNLKFKQKRKGINEVAIVHIQDYKQLQRKRSKWCPINELIVRVNYILYTWNITSVAIFASWYKALQEQIFLIFTSFKETSESSNNFCGLHWQQPKVTVPSDSGIYLDTVLMTYSSAAVISDDWTRANCSSNNISELENPSTTLPNI